MVVNYIQILYLCILKQLDVLLAHPASGCELHSNLVSLHSETTPKSSTSTTRMLWITFKSCIFAFWNNLELQKLLLRNVVNYIQILYLCILKQHTIERGEIVKVVNYIQILYLCILKQQRRYINVPNRSCELHSNLVSLHSETTSKQRQLLARRCELHSNLVSLHSETTPLLISWRKR